MNHIHLAYFGAKYGCKICNPICYKNHGFGKPLIWCSEKGCPLEPEETDK